MKRNQKIINAGYWCMFVGSMSNIMDLVIPFANASSPNVTKELVEQVSQ